MLPQLQDIALIKKQTQLCMGLFSAGTETLQYYRLQIVEAKQAFTNPLNENLLRTLETVLFDEHARLSLWSSNIGVFAEVQFSLDFRIRDEPDLQQAFIGHLEIIEDQMNIFNKVLEFDLRGNVNTSSDISQYPEDLLQMLETVHSHCDWLHKLSNLIREVSLNRQNERSDSFLWPDSEGNKSRRITENVTDGLQRFFTYLVKREISEAEDQTRHRSEDAMEQQRRLIERVAQSMVIRHRRVLYRRSRQISYSTSPTQNPLQPNLQDTARPPTTRSVVSSRPSRAKPVAPKSQAHQETATTIDKQDLRRRLVSPSTVSRGTADPVGTHDDLLYPPLPVGAEDGKDFICPYCCLIIQGSRGTPVKAWREHVSKDLTPFVCIFDDCEQESPVLYASKKQWLLHMSSQHRQEWRCTSKEHDTVQFDHPDLYADHLKLHHNEEILEDQIPLLVEVQASSIVPTLEHCPFCSETQGDLATHIGGHLKRLALQSLPNSDDAQGEIQRPDHGSSTGELGLWRSKKSSPQSDWSEFEQNEFPDSLHHTDSADVVGERIKAWEGTEDWVDQIKSLFLVDASSDGPETLSDKIRDQMVETAGGTDVFLPSDQVEELITIESVSEELKRLDISQEESLLRAHDVTDIVSTARGMSSRQRIFAMLCLLDKAAEIKSFVDEEVFDNHLPFIFNKRSSGDVHSSPIGGVEKAIQLFRSKANWKKYELEYFSARQGNLLAPYFELCIGDNQKVLHYPLPDELVLPFVQDSLDDGGAKAEVGLAMHRLGGYAIVRKVKIHPAHHNARRSDVSHDDLFFAIKELKVEKGDDAAHEKEINNEVISLKRFNDERHEHLIRLLATYTYKDRFHMIFPWADGNLMDFWKQPKPHRSSPADTIWMAKQIWGLSRALHSIHFCEISPDGNPQDPPIGAYRKPRGRHGNLKPENILWFKSRQDSQNGHLVDVLQIADFGFADFHGPDSKSNIRLSKVPGFADSYKPPEAEDMKRVSPQYDMWSLGCILSQFAVWWMWGWEGVEEFSKKRADEASPDPIKADTFYKVQHGGTRKIYLKSSVTNEFDRIKKDPASSDFILDVVQVIQWRLLRIKPDLRGTIDIVVEQFKQMYERCCKDTNYCMNRSKTERESPQRMDDIMEISRTPTPSFDMTDRLSVRSDRSSRSPQAMHGRRKRSQTPEGEKFQKDGNHRLGVQTSHLIAAFTPSSLPSSAVSETGSDTSELAGGMVVRTPEITNFSIPVGLDVTTPPIPGIVVTEDTEQSQESKTQMLNLDEDYR